MTAASQLPMWAGPVCAVKDAYALASATSEGWVLVAVVQEETLFEQPQRHVAGGLTHQSEPVRLSSPLFILGLTENTALVRACEAAKDAQTTAAKARQDRDIAEGVATGLKEKLQALEKAHIAAGLAWEKNLVGAKAEVQRQRVDDLRVLVQAIGSLEPGAREGLESLARLGNHDQVLDWARMQLKRKQGE